MGGNTKAYGAVLFRLRDTDFGEVRHVDGISPAWPISYDDLEPYYADAERLYLVHGKAGEDHTEPSRSGEFPHPPVSHEPRIQQLSDDMTRIGLHPFHLPIGIDLDESDPRARAASAATASTASRAWWRARPTHTSARCGPRSRTTT